MHAVGRGMKVDTSESSVSGSVSIGTEGDGRKLAVELDVYLPNVPAGSQQELSDGAHQMCLYSNATRGNIDVTVTIVA